MESCNKARRLLSTLIFALSLRSPEVARMVEAERMEGEKAEEREGVEIDEDMPGVMAGLGGNSISGMTVGEDVI